MWVFQRVEWKVHLMVDSWEVNWVADLVQNLDQCLAVKSVEKLGDRME